MNVNMENGRMGGWLNYVEPLKRGTAKKSKEFMKIMGDREK